MYGGWRIALAGGLPVDVDLLLVLGQNVNLIPAIRTVLKTASVADPGYLSLILEPDFLPCQI
jgi:hypothetical protein